jgi:C4-type Zn-finger protein
MPKRKYVTEDEDRERYADAECPECGATINAHFVPGRNWRKLQCPVCKSHVRVSIKEQETPLIQLKRAEE